MLFFFSSTRTRASFEAGMAQLGGHAQFIESRTTQIAHGDTPKEIGEILGRYNDGIAIRHVTWGEGNQYIREVAEASRVPVLNMQCDVYHPLQILADLMTIIEKKGSLRGRSLTISWAYAASYQKPISVPQDLVLAATRFGMNVKLVHPPEFELMGDIVAEAEANARRSGGSLERLDDFDAGFRGADIVYAKSWGAMLKAKDDEDGARIARRSTRTGSPTSAAWRSPLTTRSTCTLCRPTATSRSPTPSSTARTRSSTTRPRTGSMPRRPSWPSPCVERRCAHDPPSSSSPSGATP